LGPDAAALAEKTNALIVLGGGLPDAAWPPELLEKIKSAGLSVVIDSRRSLAAEAAGAVLVGAAWAEKSGTFINADGRVQRFDRAVSPPGEARAEVEWLSSLLAALDENEKVRSAAEVFAEMAKEVPALKGMTHHSLGAGGSRGEEG